jgi:hypothetical protein
MVYNYCCATIIQYVLLCMSLYSIYYDHCLLLFHTIDITALIISVIHILLIYDKAYCHYHL